MILVPCPFCGPRNASEFRWGGEIKRRPDPNNTTKEQWRDYLYFRRNAPDGLPRPGVTRRDAADIFEARATLSPTRFVPLTLGLNRSRSLRASKPIKRYRPASRALRTRADDRVND